MTSMILETQGLFKNFGRLKALDGIDFSVPEGEIFGIAGPNGAGKSTLFNVLAGALAPSAGRIFFRGRNITARGTHHICRLGMARTFQIPRTFHTLSVYDNIRVGATFGGQFKGKTRRDKIHECMDLLGLDAKRDLVAADLDLYTTKLVMLAAALATGCKLLMLDEPLAGLSMTEIKDYLLVISRVNQVQRVTVLMIEHILDSLFEISHRMLVLHNGRVIYTGSPANVRQDAKVVEVYLGEEDACSNGPAANPY